jgi:glycosyltransferase involved in cell wall biosynthesis
MTSPLVSVLVITYNQEDLVRETVESCLAQTFTDYEVVVSDDGSTDGTPRILRELQAQHPERLRLVLNEVNQGITANCNAGLKACRGDFVALMGGDDLLLPGKLAAQAAAFAANPKLVFSYHPCFILRDGNMDEIVGDRPKDLVANQLEMISNFGAQMPGPATMVRTSAIPSQGFRAEIGTASDWMFFIDVAAHGEVERLDEPLAVYRQHGGNVGQRYFAYTADFLETLAITRAEYGDRAGVRDAVKQGGRRFLLGGVYRSIEQGRPAQARQYAAYLRDFDSAKLIPAIYAASYLPGSGAILRGLKRTIKRYV